MSYGQIKKAINSDLQEPLNYIIWIGDLIANGKSSFVYKDVQSLTDLASNSNAVLRSDEATSYLLKGVIEAGADIGAFFASVTKNDVAFQGLTTIFDVLSNETARDVINASERAVKILGSSIYIYGFRITKAEPNPSTRVEYLHDAIGLTPASMNFGTGNFDYGGWQQFCEDINRPVMLNYDGEVVYELDRADQTLKADGSASDVANASFAGNAMAEFKKLYVHRYEDATHEYVLISPLQINENYKALAHTDASGNEKNAFYYAMYEGTFTDPRMRSIASGTPFVSQTATTEITRAVANGSGWWTITKSQWDLVNDLMTLISKSTDSQASFGNGNSGGASYLNAGTLVSSPQFKGFSTNSQAVKAFYIENMWGNYWQRMAGLLLSIPGKVLTKMVPPYPTPSGDTVDLTGFIDTDVTPTGTSGGYLKDAKFSNDSGFIPVSTTGGSATTFHACGLWYTAGTTVKYAFVGGNRDGAARCGGRAVFLYYPSSYVHPGIGSALSFL